MSPVKETPKESTEVQMVPAAEEVKKNEGILEKKPESEKVEKKEVKESEEDDDGKAEEKETKSEAGELSSTRPTRERKKVAKFTVNSSPKSAISKHLFIDKGRGEQLKDIPNVAYKLSKRKADENLRILHTILFGKKAKVHMLKKNIGNFSGFVWIDSEGKQRGKLKEKIDKCVKEKLLDFCDILNIPVNRFTIKKEELSVKLLEFLERPCATTDVLLADKETGKKRKSNDTPSRSKSKSTGTSNLAGGKHIKKPKLDLESEKKRKHSTDENKSEPSQSEDDDKKVSGTESDETGSDSEKETEEDVPKKEIVVKASPSKKSAKKDSDGSSDKSKLVDEKIPAKASNASGKSTEDSTSCALKKCIGESESNSKTKALSTKKPETEKESKMDKSPPAKIVKSPSKSSTKVLKTDQGEEGKKAKKEPTKEEMVVAVENVLRKVDFNRETLSDILKKLEERFGLDVTHRKAEVRDIITDVITELSEGEESSEDESEEEESSEDESEEDEA